MRDIVDGQLVASGFCSANQIGQRPRDRKRYKVADYPEVTNRTKGLLRTRCVAGRTGVGRPCHTCLGRSQRSERLTDETT
jgi:hypothetical protein